MVDYNGHEKQGIRKSKLLRNPCICVKCTGNGNLANDSHRKLQATNMLLHFASSARFFVFQLNNAPNSPKAAEI
jgi:hypothetical protein